MSSKRWLKAEIRKWVRNDLITSSEGEAILAQYGEESHSYKGVFFMMASLSIGGGLLSLGASFWNGLTQGQRFVTAMVPIRVGVNGPSPPPASFPSIIFPFL